MDKLRTEDFEVEDFEMSEELEDWITDEDLSPATQSLDEYYPLCHWCGAEMDNWFICRNCGRELIE